jgi:hypothetical protein
MVTVTEAITDYTEPLEAALILAGRDAECRSLVDGLGALIGEETVEHYLQRMWGPRYSEATRLWFANFGSPEAVLLHRLEGRLGRFIVEEAELGHARLYIREADEIHAVLPDRLPGAMTFFDRGMVLQSADGSQHDRIASIGVERSAAITPSTAAPSCAIASLAPPFVADPPDQAIEDVVLAAWCVGFVDVVPAEEDVTEGLALLVVAPTLPDVGIAAVAPAMPMRKPEDDPRFIHLPDEVESVLRKYVEDNPKALVKTCENELIRLMGEHPHNISLTAGTARRRFNKLQAKWRDESQ